MTDHGGELDREQKDHALDLVNEAMNRGGVFTIRGKFMTAAGPEVGVIVIMHDVELDGAGLSCTLDSGLYGYGMDDNGLYVLHDVGILKAPDPANNSSEPDPYPDYETVWEIGALEHVHMTLDDGTDEAVSFTRVLSSLAIAYAKADGREDDERLLEAWFEASAIEDAQGSADDYVSPTLTKIRPNLHYWPNAKDSNNLTDPRLFEAGGLTLDVGKRKGQMFVEFELMTDEGYGSTSIDIDRTDRQIISAVSTLKEAARRETGEPVISAYNICETMGLTHPEAEAQAEVDRRMSRLMSTVAHIDFSEEARKRKVINPDTGLPFESAVITRHLVEAQRFEGVDEGGNHYVRYKLLADPPTHEHAKLIGQEVTWPQRMQGLPALKPDGTAYRRSSTGRQIAIKHEILARTYSLMNRKSNQSDTILYDTLCRTVGVDPKNRSAKKSVVDFAEGFLRALEAEGVIKDFQPFREGSSQKKVGVELFVQQP